MDRVVKCEKCSQWITKKISDYSIKKYGKFLCWDHQQIENLKKGGIYE